MSEENHRIWGAGGWVTKGCNQPSTCRSTQPFTRCGRIKWDQFSGWVIMMVMVGVVS